MRGEDELLEHNEVKALGDRNHDSEVERLVDLCEERIISAVHANGASGTRALNLNSEFTHVCVCVCIPSTPMVQKGGNDGQDSRAWPMSMMMISLCFPSVSVTAACGGRS